MLPLSRAGLATAAVLTFAHTVGEFGVVLMVGGNIPGETRTISISVYDSVQSFDYATAGRTSLVLLAFSLVVLTLTYALQRGRGLQVGAAWDAPVSRDQEPLLDAHVRRHVVDAHLVLPGDGAAGHRPVRPVGRRQDHGPAGARRARAHPRPRPRSPARGLGRRPRLRPAPPPALGYLFQDAALFPHLDVDANVAYGLPALPRPERPARVAEALAAAGAAHLAGRRVPELSGGEAQRVALARALAPRPRLLLLDEPLSALDTPTRVRLRAELRRILLAQRIPTVLVTHDRAEALALADRVVVLIDGRVHQVGSPQEVFERPADAAVAAVVGVETAVPGTVGREPGRPAPPCAWTAARCTPCTTATCRPGPTCWSACAPRTSPSTCPHGAPQGSPRNRLPGRVTALLDEGPLVRVELDCGFALFAYVTRQSAGELDLAIGPRGASRWSRAPPSTWSCAACRRRAEPLPV